MSTKTYREPDFIDEGVASSRRIAADYRRRAAVIAKSGSALRKLRKRMTSPVYTEWLAAEAAENEKESSITMTLYMNGLDGFKDERLLDAIEVFMDSASQYSSDIARELQRTYGFLYPALVPGITIKVEIIAKVKADSPTCRKVPITVKSRIVDESEYRIVCD